MNIWPFVCSFFIIVCTSLQAQPVVGTLWLLVDAPQLDYSNFRTVLKTLSKHPRTGNKEGHFGHAWIRLTGYLDKRHIWIEGGHTGDTGLAQPRYVDGLMDRVTAGEPNPIHYLWSIQKDGYFEKGSGGHRPTYAVAVRLNEKQFRSILNAIEDYPYADYALVGNQCVEFIRTLSGLAGVTIPSCKRDIHIPNTLHLGNYRIVLWSDPKYSLFRLSTVDKLEQQLKLLASCGHVQNVTTQSKLASPRKALECLSKVKNKIQFFWERYWRWRIFSSL